jgi:hypothetical protein
LNVPEIRPGQVYTLATLTQTLGLKRSSLAREIREGRLRHAKLCGRVWFLGSWVRQWLAGGERVRKPELQEA